MTLVGRPLPSSRSIRGPGSSRRASSVRLRGPAMGRSGWPGSPSGAPRRHTNGHRRPRSLVIRCLRRHNPLPMRPPVEVAPSPSQSVPYRPPPKPDLPGPDSGRSLAGKPPGLARCATARTSRSTQLPNQKPIPGIQTGSLRAPPRRLPRVLPTATPRPGSQARLRTPAGWPILAGAPGAPGRNLRNLLTHQRFCQTKWVRSAHRPSSDPPGTQRCPKRPLDPPGAPRVRRTVRNDAPSRDDASRYQDDNNANSGQFVSGTHP